LVHIYLPVELGRHALNDITKLTDLDIQHFGLALGCNFKGRQHTAVGLCYSATLVSFEHERFAANRTLDSFRNCGGYV
jgi:hypothetical protein